MNQGKVYWITGLAGAGKTSVGNLLYSQMKKKEINTVILDGDILKNLTTDSLGYSNEKRRNRAKKYSYLCRTLAEQGINVIICTIAMFDEVRKWNRENIENYIEVFLDVDMEVLCKRNKKGLYETASGNMVAGVDVSVEFPKNPDIVIHNNGDVSIKEIVSQILSYPVGENKLYVNDTQYWDSYYRRQSNAPQEESSFAQYTLHFMEKGKLLLDLGCGNGRDSRYFAANGINVTGVDASREAIEKLSEEAIPNASFLCGDFVCMRNLYLEQYDYCYSRFTLHAINEKQENELLKNIEKTLKIGGIFFVEARTIHDAIYGMGQAVGKNEFIYDGHYRRFIDIDEFRNKVEGKRGFEIMEITEGIGRAKYRESDPMLMRAIIRKKA